MLDTITYYSFVILALFCIIRIRYLENTFWNYFQTDTYWCLIMRGFEWAMWKRQKNCSCSSENINQCLDSGRYEGFSFWGTFPGGQNPPGFSQQHRSKISPVSWIFFKPVQFKWHSNFSLIQVILQATILFVNLFPFENLN